MHKNIRNYGELWKSQIQGVSRVQPFPASARKKLMVTVAGGSECGVAGKITRGGEPLGGLRESNSCFLFLLLITG